MKRLAALSGLVVLALVLVAAVVGLLVLRGTRGPIVATPPSVSLQGFTQGTNGLQACFRVSNPGEGAIVICLQSTITQEANLHLPDITRTIDVTLRGTAHSDIIVPAPAYDAAWKADFVYIPYTADLPLRRLAKWCLPKGLYSSLPASVRTIDASVVSSEWVKRKQ
jgi:hypothetical protein